MRNQIGINTEIWAGATAGSERTPIDDFTLGWTSDYTASLYPDRRYFNDAMSRVSATCFDVNTFGSALPWDIAVPFGLYALVTGSDGLLYVSTQANTGNDPITPANRPLYWKALSDVIAPASSTTVSGIAEIATQAEMDAGTDGSRIVTPLTHANFNHYAPYYHMITDGGPNLSIPSDFGTDTKATTRWPSYGEINYSNSKCMKNKSQLWTMKLNVTSGVSSAFRLFKVDKYVGIFVDGSLQSSSTSYDSVDGKDLPYTLTAGLRTLQIVTNDQGSNDNTLSMLGTIISPTVKFIHYS